jgi:hypothetical protein
MVPPQPNHHGSNYLSDSGLSDASGLLQRDPPAADDRRQAAPAIDELEVPADLVDVGEPAAAGRAVMAIGELEVLADLVDVGEPGRGQAAVAIGKREVLANLVDVGRAPPRGRGDSAAVPT